jgi:hypothetical protein
MNLDYEIELRQDLRLGRRVHIVNTSEGMILAHGFPYHGSRFIRIPAEMEADILKLCADPTLPEETTGPVSRPDEASK